MSNEKKHFIVRLNPPRPTFAADMTDDEKAVMQRHVTYWMPYLNDGTLIVFGPVMDPKATFGMAVLAVDNEEQLDQLVKNDPATALGTVDVFPMKAVTMQS